MRDLLRQAEQILETAAAANADETQDLAICVPRSGGLRIINDPSGWSFPGLAAETGASAVFRVGRRRGTVCVEAWSPQETCVLRRALPPQPRPSLSLLPCAMQF